MNMVALILENSVDTDLDVFRESVTFQHMAAQGSVGTINGLTGWTPEIAYFGLNAEEHVVAPGPVTIAALGKVPPEASVQFHLSLASLDQESRVLATPELPDHDEEQAVLRCVESLSSRTWVCVPGEGLDHGLVWEQGSLELGTCPVAEANGRQYGECLPEGDGEGRLRMLIDDSVNILDEQDFNKRRADQGVPKLNLLWPWGQGMRPQLPNLTLERASPTHFESRSLRVAGLARLLGQTHGRRQDFGRRLAVDWSRLASITERYSSLVIVAGHLGEAVKAGRVDEAVAMLQEASERFLEPIAQGRETSLLVVGTGAQGIYLDFDPQHRKDSAIPFDSRVLGDSKVPRRELWEVVSRHLRP